MASTTVKNFRSAPARLDCAEVFFKCLENFSGDGYGSMVDSIRGCTYNPLLANTGQFYDPETGEGAAGTPIAAVFWMDNGTSTSVASVYPINSEVTTLEYGTWPNFANKKIILFGCGVHKGSGAIAIGGVDAGSPIGGNISISCSGGFHGPVKGPSGVLLDDPSDGGLGLLTAGTIGDVVMFVGEYTPKVGGVNGSYRIRMMDVNGAVKQADNATNLDLSLTVSVEEEITPHLNNMTRPRGIEFYSITCFAFTGELPPEAVREKAYKWMIRHHSAEHRELPPQFVGYS